jgi:uncharacterized membrane protein
MPVWPVLRAVGAGILAVAWAIASYFNSASGHASGWGTALALAPLSLVVVLGLWRMPRRWLAAVLALLLTGGLVGLWPWLNQRIATLYFLEHMGVYSLLAVFFARTLSGPGESLVTQMARRVHGGVLSEGQQRYTRQVTMAWSVFFAAMVLVSIGLFFWAPLPVWSAFATLLGGPLIVAMFVVELLVRRWVLPNEARASMRETMQAWRVQRSNSDQ